MVSAKILSYSVSANETVADLQRRIEQDTNIPPANQELLLEAGLALESGGRVLQCAVDYAVNCFFYKLTTCFLTPHKYPAVFCG